MAFGRMMSLSITYLCAGSAMVRVERQAVLLETYAYLHYTIIHAVRLVSLLVQRIHILFILA